jgi:hypothetical protein
VRGCARLYAVHSGYPFCGPGPGERQLLRVHFLYDYFILPYYIVCVYIMW